MAQPFIPTQSAAPLGQAPSSPLQAPGVGMSLPDGIDSNALYSSLAASGQALSDALAVRRQTMDEMATALDRMKAMGDAAKDAFSDMYKVGKANKAGSIGGLPGLDSRYRGPRRVNQKISGIMEQHGARVDAITKAAVNSGALSDPKQMANMEREIQKVMNDTKVQLSKEQDYIKYQRAEQAFESLDDAIYQAKEDGLYISPEYDAHRKRREAYLNEEPGAVIRDQELNPERYIFDLEGAVDRLNKDFTQRFKPQSRSEVIDVNGNKQERIVTETPTVDETIDDIMQIYGNDPDIQGIYEYAKLSTGFKGSKEDWLRAYAQQFSKLPTDKMGKNLYKKPKPSSGRRPGGGDDDQTRNYTYEPRSYSEFINNDFKTDTEARFIKGRIGSETTSTTDVTEGIDIHGQVGEFGFDPMSINNLGSAIEERANKKNLKYRYDKYNDRLLIGVMDDGDDFRQIAFADKKFTDYQENSGIPKHPSFNKESAEYHIPPEIDVIPDPQFKEEVFESTETASDVREIAPYAALYKKLYWNEKVDKDVYQSVMGPDAPYKFGNQWGKLVRTEEEQNKSRAEAVKEKIQSLLLDPAQPATTSSTTGTKYTTEDVATQLWGQSN